MKEFLRVLKFIFFSISAGIIEFLSFSILTEITSLSYWPRYLIALVLSVLWNFTFNRKFTFQSSANVKVAMLKVLIYYLIFTPFSLYFGEYLVSIGINDYVVTLINMLINFITEFIYQRYYVFKNSIDTKPVKI